MEFRIQRKENENVHKYPTEDVGLAKKFSDLLQKELGDFLITTALFGSSARREKGEQSDIDLIVITDDASYIIDDSLVEGYRIIIESLVQKVSLKLHITSMTFTSFWEHVKAGDPVIVNILRDGVPLLDKGLFEPLQILLKQGRIRPSEESIWRYFGRSPKTLLSSRWRLLQASLDLYWAVIDSAHAALMRAHQVPPTPEHVADLLDKVFVRNKLLEKKYVDIMRQFYNLSKNITHRSIKQVTGPEYEKYYKDADSFVRRMKSLIENRKY